MATSPAKKISHSPLQESAVDASTTSENNDGTDDVLEYMLSEGGFTIEEIRGLIAEGMESLDRGEGMTMEEVYDQIHAQRELLRSKSQG